MIRFVVRLGVLGLIAAALGCASAGKTTGKATPYCPKCKTEVVRHRFSRSSNRAGHAHVRYICPSCGKERKAAPDGTAHEVMVCPKCGCTLKECPSCCKTLKK